MRGRVEGARRVLIGRKDPVPEEKKKGSQRKTEFMLKKRNDIYAPKAH